MPMSGTSRNRQAACKSSDLWFHSLLVPRTRRLQIGWGTLAWLNRFRRLAIRYERRADIHLAFTTLGRVFICLNRIRRLCPTG
jgi:hypothetical protein